MLEDHFNETVTVQRLAAVSGDSTGIKKDFVNWITGLYCAIYPVEDNITQDINVGFGKNLEMVCNIEDIIEGDQVIWGDDTYRVVGVKTYFKFLGIPRFMQITLRAFKS